MAKHFVKVVEDGSLITDDGWAMVRCEDTGDLYFMVEKGAASSPETLSTAWSAAANLVIENAVREGHVQYVNPPEEPEEEEG